MPTRASRPTSERAPGTLYKLRNTVRRSGCRSLCKVSGMEEIVPPRPRGSLLQINRTLTKPLTGPSIPCDQVEHRAKQAARPNSQDFAKNDPAHVFPEQTACAEQAKM